MGPNPEFLWLGALAAAAAAYAVVMGVTSVLLRATRGWGARDAAVAALAWPLLAPLLLGGALGRRAVAEQCMLRQQLDRVTREYQVAMSELSAAREGRVEVTSIGAYRELSTRLARFARTLPAGDREDTG